MDERHRLFAMAVGVACSNGYPTAPNQFINDVLRHHIPADESAYRSVMFEHDFARGLWGDRAVPWQVGNYQLVGPDGKPAMIPAYLFHMAQMAATVDPFDYLQKHFRETLAYIH
jgi:hypothetical protein